MTAAVSALRAVALLVIGALVASACANSADPAGRPSISIDSLEVAGRSVTIVVTAGDGGAPAAISVAWGDGTEEPAVQGVGEFAYTHTYGAEVPDATVTVTATADGVVASDVARVQFDAPATTTTILALDTTTTIADTTTTTEAPTTTTAAPATTTSTSTTTTTQPPTTTTSPPPVVVDLDLDIGAAKIVSRWGDGAKQSKWSAPVASAKVTRHADTWEEDGIQISFPIPMAVYEDLLVGAERVLFEFTAYVDLNYELDSDKSDGNAAKLYIDFTGNRYYGWAGETLRESIGADDRITIIDTAEFSGEWAVSAESFDIAQDIDLTLECRAKGPGGVLVSSDSRCDASIGVRQIAVRITVE